MASGDEMLGPNCFEINCTFISTTGGSFIPSFAGLQVTSDYGRGSPGIATISS